uniref:Nuclear receptor domain-containing protein n=1 Tax=Steinernema glaseri TaxID=37863 RepID=A0A1I8AV28_9BILA
MKSARNHSDMTDEQLQEELKKPCRVCGHESKGFHFGVVTCRACAAFFRRTVAEEKIYICRQNGVCPIRHERRNMCRACRFKRCESVGMNKDDVQLNRDSIKPPSSVESQQSRPEQLPTVSSPEDPSTAQSVQKQEPVYQEPIMVRAVYPYEVVLLNKMLDGYRSYQSCQKSLYIVKYPRKLGTIAQPEEVKLSDYAEMDKGCVTLAHQMLVEHFDPFGSFAMEERRKFLRNFYIPFTVIDQCYFSSLYFPNPTETRFYLHYRQYMDSSNLIPFFDTEHKPEESARFVTFLFARTRRLINRFVALKLSEMEIGALAGLILWTVVTNNIEAESPLIEDKRNRIHFELHRLYVHLYGSDEAGVRFGSVLSIITEALEIAKLCKESVALSKIFNLTRENNDRIWSEF